MSRWGEAPHTGQNAIDQVRNEPKLGNHTGPEVREFGPTHTKRTPRKIITCEDVTALMEGH
jgi:hypothetical protein